MDNKQLAETMKMMAMLQGKKNYADPDIERSFIVGLKGGRKFARVSIEGYKPSKENKKMRFAFHVGNGYQRVWTPFSDLDEMLSLERFIQEAHKELVEQYPNWLKMEGDLEADNSVSPAQVAEMLKQMEG